MKHRYKRAYGREGSMMTIRPHNDLKAFFECIINAEKVKVRAIVACHTGKMSDYHRYLAEWLHFSEQVRADILFMEQYLPDPHLALVKEIVDADSPGRWNLYREKPEKRDLS